MQEWTDIRRKVLVEGVSRKQIRKDYHLGWETLQRILANPEPPGYQLSKPRPKTKVGPYLVLIEGWLAEDREAPPKQRHTSKRIFERLRDEYGYQGGITQVKEAVARHKRYRGDVHMPLSHEPGEGQFDFGEAWAVIGGTEQKAHYAVTALPASDALFVKAYPRENTETFQDAHASAFRFFGGVPTKMRYDNTSIAVTKIAGRERDLTGEFLRLQSHYLFAERFCNPGKGNEKGNVEGGVGYSRRNWMVPIPRFSDWASFNAYLERCCREDLSRVLWGQTLSKGELLKVDQAAMLPLPSSAFEARRIVKTRATSLSLVRFDRNDYSVPTAFAHHEVVAIGGLEEVKIACADRLVARHPRCWGKEQVTYDPRHYLALLERKPGALDDARPLSSWELPGCFALLRRRLEADLGHAGTREYIKVLRLLEHSSVRRLAGAVRYALKIGASLPEAIELILRQRTERPVAMFSLDGHPHLKPYVIEVPDLHAYAELEGARS